MTKPSTLNQHCQQMLREILRFYNRVSCAFTYNLWPFSTLKSFHVRDPINRNFVIKKLAKAVESTNLIFSSLFLAPAIYYQEFKGSYKALYTIFMHLNAENTIKVLEIVPLKWVP